MLPSQFEGDKGFAASWLRRKEAAFMSTGQADSRNMQREYQRVSGLKMAHAWRY
jgi:hypothetical protein